ncbi:Grx4 family monothiol glutaredoxin [Albidovulum sediminis]|jgi:monothiol glutaredoxin|uniref:Glutaredoxin n=1 Tax=Albidovulum sediminis TaxID=3066345 RepID=A0ABT2NIQ9_9RHOB|nr:Grx4 family monothiol glutaredoxin [Defluviimonas sediminis]MCT8328620.1 Grx4 family monothiol glutaredoxin [Defluviimonas sediminis]
MTTTTAQDQIRETVTANDVVLFMKGTKSMPQCGFSSRVAGVLNYMGVDFVDVNVLADAEIRQGIKDFSDWPTIPQLYVKGEFVGGCDIVTEMTLSGELDQLFEAKGIGYSKEAADKIREANA